MTYITTCFYCDQPLKLRESVLVKDSLSREIKHRYHQECYLKLTEPIARNRIALNSILEEMRLAKVTSSGGSQVSEPTAPAGS